MLVHNDTKNSTSILEMYNTLHVCKRLVRSSWVIGRWKSDKQDRDSRTLYCIESSIFQLSQIAG